MLPERQHWESTLPAPVHLILCPGWEQMGVELGAEQKGSVFGKVPLVPLMHNCPHPTRGHSHPNIPCSISSKDSLLTRVQIPPSGRSWESLRCRMGV